MMKLCQRWQIDTQQVILFNYAFAFLITLAPILFRVLGSAGVPVQDFLLKPTSVWACVLQGILFLAVPDPARAAELGAALPARAVLASRGTDPALDGPHRSPGRR